jgi:hypothetical protein
MAERGHRAHEGQRGILECRTRLSGAVQDLIEPGDLLLSFRNVLLKPGGNSRIVLDPADLGAHDRKRLVFHGVRVAQPGHEYLASLV